MSYFDTVYSDDLLSHRAQSVYIYLRGRADAQSQCWPAIRTIARELALSESTVKRAIQDLKDRGYLQARHRWRKMAGKAACFSCC